MKIYIPQRQLLAIAIALGLVACWLLVLAATAHAEENPLRAATASGRQLADRVSTAAVAGNVIAATVDAWRADNRRQAFAREGCTLAGTIGGSEVGKLLIHRTRPNGLNRKSMPSQHTAIAVGVGVGRHGWRLVLGIPLATVTGLERMRADMHYGSDVAAGAGLGLLAQWGCGAWLG